MFVVVKKVVEEAERKVLSKFGEHYRSLAAVASGATGGAAAEKVFLVGKM